MADSLSCLLRSPQNTLKNKNRFTGLHLTWRCQRKTLCPYLFQHLETVHSPWLMTAAAVFKAHIVASFLQPLFCPNICHVHYDLCITFFVGSLWELCSCLDNPGPSFHLQIFNLNHLQTPIHNGKWPSQYFSDKSLAPLEAHSFHCPGITKEVLKTQKPACLRWKGQHFNNAVHMLSQLPTNFKGRIRSSLKSTVDTSMWVFRCKLGDPTAGSPHYLKMIGNEKDLKLSHPIIEKRIHRK